MRSFLWVFSHLLMKFVMENFMFCAAQESSLRHDFISAFTAQNTKFSIKDFFSKCDQIRLFLRMWSHLLKKSFMENFVFCAATDMQFFKPKTWLVCRVNTRSYLVIKNKFQ